MCGGASKESWIVVHVQDSRTFKWNIRGRFDFTSKHVRAAVVGMAEGVLKEIKIPTCLSRTMNERELSSRSCGRDPSDGAMAIALFFF